MVDISIKSKKTKLILGSALCFLVIVVLSFLIKKDIASIENLNNKIEADKNKIVVLSKIYDDANSKGPEINRVLASIPESYEEISTYAKVVEAVASSANVTIETNFADTQAKDSQGIQSIGITLKGTGSYANLVKFLDGISELPYHITIDSLNVAKVQGVMNLNMMFRLYTNIN